MPSNTDAAPVAEPILSVRGVSKHFGSLAALSDLSFDVGRDEIFGIAGPNGAGKSTLLNVCTGLLSVDAGTIWFDATRIDRLPPHRRCALGLARTFQIPQVFTSLSVEENIATGAMFGAGQRLPTTRVRREAVDHILNLIGLSDRRHESARHIDLLSRKAIMLGAALATRPKLVFMDEPLAGLTGDEIDHMVDLVFRLKQELNITFMLIEHKVRALTTLSDRILITHQGSLICLDTPENVIRDEAVIEHYLGSGYLA